MEKVHVHVHAMKWLFIFRRDLVVPVCCFFMLFVVHIFISFKYDVHVDTERMIVKT